MGMYSCAVPLVVRFPLHCIGMCNCSTVALASLSLHETCGLIIDGEKSLTNTRYRAFLMPHAWFFALSSYLGGGLDSVST